METKCPNFNIAGGSIRLFGVQLQLNQCVSKPRFTDPITLPPPCGSSVGSCPAPSSHRFLDGETSDKHNSSYVTDDTARPSYRKRVAWTPEEHRKFFLGLEQLGKGNWSGISRNFVTTKTPSQVALHAEKYFLAQKKGLKRKFKHEHDPSPFDVVEKDESAVQAVPKTTPMTNGLANGWQTLPKIDAQETCGPQKQESKGSRVSIPVSQFGSVDTNVIPSTMADIHSSPPNLELSLAAPNHLLVLLSQELSQCYENNSKLTDMHDKSKT